jgi:hypothetical protein
LLRTRCTEAAEGERKQRVCASLRARTPSGSEIQAAVLLSCRAPALSNAVPCDDRRQVRLVRGREWPDGGVVPERGPERRRAAVSGAGGGSGGGGVSGGSICGTPSGAAMA